MAEAPGAMVFAFSRDLMGSTLMSVGKLGVEGACYQVYDPDPTNESSPVTIDSEQLDRAEARKVLTERRDEGFSGIMGFTCLDDSGSLLILESFDLRNDVSIRLTCPVKRTFTGRLKPTSDPTLHGDAEPLPT